MGCDVEPRRKFLRQAPKPGQNTRVTIAHNTFCTNLPKRKFPAPSWWQSDVQIRSGFQGIAQNTVAFVASWQLVRRGRGAVLPKRGLYLNTGDHHLATVFANHDPGDVPSDGHRSKMAI
ncbi:hypothetical protein PEL8287_03300 [Roseovarius litorisediminis]|uniref:Uncharacterized protein n=1 Tax=Roseovarius litorisediminis TaxID=1312363 RepID=A0A1Y5TCS5_9RHOB|nr:hypothetical protein PEL8287_03300 [Roseovarius litorisediminis]